MELSEMKSSVGCAGSLVTGSLLAHLAPPFLRVMSGIKICGDGGHPIFDRPMNGSGTKMDDEF